MVFRWSSRSVGRHSSSYSSLLCFDAKPMRDDLDGECGAEYLSSSNNLPTSRRHHSRVRLNTGLQLQGAASHFWPRLFPCFLRKRAHQSLFRVDRNLWSAARDGVPKLPSRSIELWKGPARATVNKCANPITLSCTYCLPSLLEYSSSPPKA